MHLFQQTHVVEFTVNSEGADEMSQNVCCLIRFLNMLNRDWLLNLETPRYIPSKVLILYQYMLRKSQL